MPAKANTESSAGTLLQPEAASFEEPPRFGEYDGFLSYSHEDEALVADLQARLERFGRPVRRARSLRLFRDATNLPMTLDLWPAISRRIDASSSLILIASPNSAGKPWPAKEALHFLQRDGVSATRFGIILIQGSLPWVDGPTAMTRADCAIHADLHARLTALGVEPLVIDLRRFVNRGRLYLQWDRNYQMLLARIAAAILDRDPDELYGAHLRYRRIVFGLAIAALALIVGGIVWAMEATSEGMHRRAEAMFEKGRRALSEGDPIAAEAWMTAAIQVHDTPDRRLALADTRLLGYRRIWVVPIENMDGSRLAIDPERRQVVVWTAHETRVLEADSGRESWRTAHGGSDVALLGPRRLLAVDGHQALLISHGDDKDIETIALPDDCGTYRGLVVDAAREMAVIGSTTGCLAFLSTGSQKRVTSL